MIVRITVEAARDLEQIGDYIARDNPRRAITFIQELRAKCLDLAYTPQGFPLTPGYEERGVRRRVHGNYLIFYRVEAESIVILHVMHGAMDYGAILFPSGPDSA